MVHVFLQGQRLFELGLCESQPLVLVDKHAVVLDVTKGQDCSVLQLDTLEQSLLFGVFELLLSNLFEVFDVLCSVENLRLRELAFMTNERHLHLLGHVLTGVTVERATQAIVARRCVLAIGDNLFDYHSVVHIPQADTILLQELVVEGTVVQEFLVVARLQQLLHERELRFVTYVKDKLVVFGTDLQGQEGVVDKGQASSLGVNLQNLLLGQILVSLLLCALSNAGVMECQLA